MHTHTHTHTIFISNKRRGNKFGFTLAEILITLGIIGVVAALTIPTLVKNYQEQVYLNQFKNVYTNISQAYQQAVTDTGSNADTWTAEDAYNNLKATLKVAKDCGFNTPCAGANNGNIKSLAGDTTFVWMKYHLTLADGSTIRFGAYTTDDNKNAIELQVNTNGTKPPNQLGYDYFFLSLHTKNNAPVTGYYQNGWARKIWYCDKEPYPGSGWYRGGACSYWILKHWNMDYLNREISSAEWNE